MNAISRFWIICAVTRLAVAGTAYADTGRLAIGTDLRVTVGDLSPWPGAATFIAGLKSVTGVQVSPVTVGRETQYADVTIMIEPPNAKAGELVVRRGYQGAELGRFPLTPDSAEPCAALLRREQEWQAWLHFHNPHPPGWQVQMRLVPATVSKTADGHVKWLTDAPLIDNVIQVGDHFTVEVRNRGARDVYVNILDLADGDVNLLWPSARWAGFSNRIAGGRPDKWVKLATPAAEPALYSATAFQKPQAYPYEYWKLLAATEPFNLSDSGWGSNRGANTLQAFAQGSADWTTSEILLTPRDKAATRVVMPASLNAPDVFEFDAAARQHKISLFDMSNVRATTFQATSAPDASWLNVCEWLTENDPRDTAVLFYTYAEPKLQIWVLTTEGIQAYTEADAPRTALEESIAALRSALGVSAITTGRAPRLRHPAAAPTESTLRGTAMDAPPSAVPLSQSVSRLDALLLPRPVADALATTRHLIVVPALDIGTIPFAILGPLGTSHQIVDRMSVSIAPSLYDLNANAPAWMEPGGTACSPKSALVVGNPYLSHDPTYVYPPLPGAEAEVRTVAATLNIPSDDLLFGKAATLPAIVAAMPHSGMVYFATHGIADSRSPLTGNFLAFSPGPHDDGRLTQDYMDKNRDLHSTQLVVLSACQTGLGMAEDAGMISLARGFQIAGAPRVVMSLWSVHDQATADLMESFTRHLKTEVPAEALRDAMRETRAKHPDPVDWASFAFFGTPR